MLYTELITGISSSRLCQLLLLPSMISEQTQLMVLHRPVAGYIRPMLAHSPEAQDPEWENGSIKVSQDLEPIVRVR
jgi:hypothetical protein